MQQQQQPAAIESCLVLSNSKDEFNKLALLLQKYFPSPSPDSIHIDTKYYLANIRLVRTSWPQIEQIPLNFPSNAEQQLHFKPNPSDKQSLIIMLIHEQETFPPQMYDYVINKYNPQNYILILNTPSKNKPWKDQDKIANEVNNFIEIIKENLDQLNANPPQRLKKGLLTDTYEDGSIFNLLELIQTTPWINIKRKTFDNKEKTKKEALVNLPQEKVETQLHVQNIVPGEQEEMTDQQLENEMKGFESLMLEMMNLKTLSGQAQGLPDSDRKQKAEELMKKLVGAWL